MSFYEYIMNFKGEDTVYGDLSRDMMLDNDITDEMKKDNQKLYKYLYYVIRDYEVMEIFEELKEKYETDGEYE